MGILAPIYFCLVGTVLAVSLEKSACCGLLCTPMHRKQLTLKSVGSRFDPEAGHQQIRHDKAQNFVIWAFHIWPFGLGVFTKESVLFSK